VESLWFPVKRFAVFLTAATFVACGYAPVYGGERPEQRLTLRAAPQRTPHLAAVEATVAGARSELSRAGVLAAGGGYPCLVVEVVRVDELPSGIVAEPPAGASEAEPVARGSRVSVTARGWVLDGPSAAPARDTGDIRRVEHFATALDPRAESQTFDSAVRAAAVRVGRAIARRVLGVPEPTIESL
jgi:hypothetical protein